jgi:hypothetical protein
VVCGAGTPSSPFKICSCLHTTTTPRQTHIMIPTTRSIPPTPATTPKHTDTIQPLTILPTPPPNSSVLPHHVSHARSPPYSHTSSFYTSRTPTTRTKIKPNPAKRN